MKKIVLLFNILLMFGCTSNNSYYRKSDVTVLDVNLDGKTIEIYYLIPLETLFYSSGVDYRYNNTSGQIDIAFVRQIINNKDSVMVPSLLVKNTGDSKKIKKFGINSYVVEIPIEKQWGDINEKREIINIVNKKKPSFYGFFILHLVITILMSICLR